jgi:hypothetical protein
MPVTQAQAHTPQRSDPGMAPLSLTACSPPIWRRSPPPLALLGESRSMVSVLTETTALLRPRLFAGLTNLVTRGSGQTRDNKATSPLARRRFRIAPSTVSFLSSARTWTLESAPKLWLVSGRRTPRLVAARDTSSTSHAGHSATTTQAPPASIAAMISEIVRAFRGFDRYGRWSCSTTTSRLRFGSRSACRRHRLNEQMLTAGR